MTIVFSLMPIWSARTKWADHIRPVAEAITALLDQVCTGFARGESPIDAELAKRIRLQLHNCIKHYLYIGPYEIRCRYELIPSVKEGLEDSFEYGIRTDVLVTFTNDPDQSRTHATIFSAITTKEGTRSDPRNDAKGLLCFRTQFSPAQFVVVTALCNEMRQLIRVDADALDEFGWRFRQIIQAMSRAYVEAGTVRRMNWRAEIVEGTMGTRPFDRYACFLLDVRFEFEDTFTRFSHFVVEET